jgi:hypothetical protein
MVTKPIERLKRIEDPRQLRGRRHLLSDVLVIALRAVWDPLWQTSPAAA